MKHPFVTSPAYVQSVHGLHRLHALTLAGKSQSPEADALRDSLEAPWYALSESEQKRIIGLSEDLYSISDPPAEPWPSNPQATSRLMEVTKSLYAGDWDHALQVLRRWGKHLEPAYLSWLRGSIWQEMDDFATAVLFYRHAVDLEPQSERNLASYLWALGQSDPGEAFERAKALVSDDQDHPPMVVANAGAILLRASRLMGLADRIPLIQRTVGALNRALDRLANEGTSFGPPGETRKTIYSLLGTCSLSLGDARAALRAYDAAIAIDPDEPGLLTSRGVVRYGLGLPGALEDFSLAARNDPRAVWPSFFLAHQNLTAGRFDECRKYCDRALDGTAPDVLRPRLYQWRAIARSELGFPEEMVRSDFEEAIRLAPEDDEIRENFARFNRSSGQPGARPHDWSVSKPSGLQALYTPETPPPMRDRAA